MLDLEQLERIDRLERTIRAIVQYNDPMYNYNKLAEEMAELLELVLKMINKKEPHQPSAERLKEEMADVQLRLSILRHANGWENDMEALYKKAEKLQGYMDEGKYQGGI